MLLSIWLHRPVSTFHILIVLAICRSFHLLSLLTHVAVWFVSLWGAAAYNRSGERTRTSSVRLASRLIRGSSVSSRLPRQLSFEFETSKQPLRDVTYLSWPSNLFASIKLCVIISIELGIIDSHRQLHDTTTLTLVTLKYSNRWIVVQRPLNNRFFLRRKRKEIVNEEILKTTEIEIEW